MQNHNEDIIFFVNSQVYNLKIFKGTLKFSFVF